MDEPAGAARACCWVVPHECLVSQIADKQRLQDDRAAAGCSCCGQHLRLQTGLVWLLQHSAVLWAAGRLLPSVLSSSAEQADGP